MKQEISSFKRLNPDNFYNLADLCDDVFFWETDARFTITFVNQAILNHTAIEKKHLVGTRLTDFLIANESNAWERLKQSKQDFKNLNFKIKTQKGQFIYLNVNGHVIYQKGQIAGYCGVCSLETVSTISKEVIKRLRSTNKIIVNSLKEALAIIDNNGKFVLVNPEFNRLWRLKKDFVFNHSLQENIEKMKEMLVRDKRSESFSLKSSEKKTKDIVKLKDGRTLERRSYIHMQGKENKGRCWYFKDVSQQLNLVERLGNLAFRDSLTKLYNRRWCEKKLKQLLRSKKSESLTFLYMDLDHFKVINDSCGHIHGDDVLEQISQLLIKAVGEKAFLARLGGDEFGLMLLNKTDSEVLSIAEDIKNTITGYTYQWKNKIFKIGISIGVVFVDEEDDFRSVFVHADEACYMSKETGRNKCTVYNAEKDEFKKTKTELKWYDAIQKALLRGKFELWCQSINDTKSLNPHYEILLRMRTENNELISPALFMSSADRFGMIFTIDKQVIDSFCRFYHNNYSFVKTTMFSLNISGTSISREGFLPFVLNCFDKYSVACRNICFEITENEIIKNLDKALVFIKEVRKLGCKISLDDFGKGLTSFAYLKNIPYDYIKIDGQFIKELNNDKINEAIIKSIVYIADVMDKKTIAEHIESEEILNQIAALGVNYFQGNYFSKPHQITKLLE